MFKQQTQNASAGVDKQKEEKNPENEAEGAGSVGAETQNNSGSAESGQTASENGEKQAAELTPDERIAELEAKLAETLDQLLRKAADFENFRKRMNQEKQSAIEYANQSLLLDIIPVIDDFERAIMAGESSTDFATFLDGVKMIEKRLTSQLEAKWGLKRFTSAGEPFDPNKHEALMMEKSPDVNEPTVQEDFSKGYLLKDRVIRAAKVKVLMPAAENGE